MQLVINRAIVRDCVVRAEVTAPSCWMKPDKKIDARRLAENEEKKIEKALFGFFNEKLSARFNAAWVNVD